MNLRLNSITHWFSSIRNKLKLWHHETKQRNIKLEEENGKLRAEVRQLKSLLLAHQDCSVSKAMALGAFIVKSYFFPIFIIWSPFRLSTGKHIPVGLPKMIVKEQNSDNISIINDVSMNPVFLIVNKPFEYNSTVSISWGWNSCSNMRLALSIFIY